MNRKQKIIISVTGIFLVMLILLGLTYAYFLTQIKGNTNDKSISIATANLSLEYLDGTPDILTKDKIVPNTVIGKKEFTVKNTGDSDIDSYAVVLEDLKITYAETSGTDIKGTITYLERPEDFEVNVLCELWDSYATIWWYDVEYTSAMPSTNDILYTASLKAGEDHVCELKLTYKEAGVDQSKDMNKKIEAKINIIDTKDTVDLEGTITNFKKGDYIKVNSEPKISYPNKDGKYKVVGLKPDNHVVSINKDTETSPISTKEIIIKKGANQSVLNNEITINDNSRTISMDIDPINKTFNLSSEIELYNIYSSNKKSLAYNIINNAQNITEEQKGLLYADYSIKPKTEPGKQTSSSDESTLSLAYDNYGPTYYFRGNVENNYVEFNNMCWRIVRIEGDGSVKITLAKEDLCSTIKSSDTSSAFIGTGDYGYNDKMFADYENHLNRPSSMSYKFNVFIKGGSFTTRIGDYWDEKNTTKTYSAWNSTILSKIKSTKICLGDLKTYYDGNIELTQDEFNSLVNGTDMYGITYGDGKRLKNNELSFGCDYEDYSEKEYKIYPLLTDEAIYAGFKIDSNSNNVYLQENASNSYGWWTSYIGERWSIEKDQPFHVDGSRLTSQNSTQDNRINENKHLRPVISLIQNIEITNTNATGTMNDPYIIAS